jgi:hypothetical protein
MKVLSKTKRIQEMIESAFTKKQAMDMLETWRIFGSITNGQYHKGRKLIEQQFKK